MGLSLLPTPEQGKAHHGRSEVREVFHEQAGEINRAVIAVNRAVALLAEDSVKYRKVGEYFARGMDPLEAGGMVEVVPTETISSRQPENQIASLSNPNSVPSPEQGVDAIKAYIESLHSYMELDSDPMAGSN